MSDSFIAIDLGAESGRAMLVTLVDGRVSLQEAHRFDNKPVHLPSGLHWNVTRLWADIVTGFGKAVRRAKQNGSTVRSVGVDTWGVDFGLVGKSGQLLGLPQCYRDERHPPAQADATKILGENTAWESTGIAGLPFNTLYQMHAQRAQEPVVLESAERLLWIPDLLHYWLCGEMRQELTIASTGQMLKAGKAQWADDLLGKLGLPTQLLDEPTMPGTKIGTVRKAVMEAAGVPDADPIAVVVPPSHDTASAVAAVPADLSGPAAGNWAYISSGTWSLMGLELDEPVVTDEAREANFTNELGVGDHAAKGAKPKVRFLKNIAGLWLVQQLRADIETGGQRLDYETLTHMASASDPWRTLVDCDYAPLASPGHAREKIATFAKQTGQPVPETPGHFVRCCLDSLALEYRRTLHGLQDVTGRSVDVLHIVGGGGQNQLLDQLTADTCEIPVIVGPYEATALGNGLVQAMGLGKIGDLAELRGVLRDSVSLLRFEPKQRDTIAEQAKRYEELKSAAV